jgi:hypothetical protein
MSEGVKQHTRDRLRAINADLLAACEAVRVYLDHGEGDAPNGLRLISAKETLTAAIAKARGEATS